MDVSAVLIVVTGQYEIRASVTSIHLNFWSSLSCTWGGSKYIRLAPLTIL